MFIFLWNWFYWIDNLINNFIRENAPAKLRQVCWLEVTGTAKKLEAGKYQVSFLLSKEQDAFGWNNCQPFLMAKVGKKGKYKWKKVLELNEDKKENITIVSEPIEVKDNDEKELYFGLYEVWSGKWKGGLCIHEACVKKVPN